MKKNFVRNRNRKKIFEVKIANTDPLQFEINAFCSYLELLHIIHEIDNILLENSNVNNFKEKVHV